MGITIHVRHFTQLEWPESTGKKTKTNVRTDVFCWGSVDLTDARAFNGVEQCEKCLSVFNSTVHHTTFIWIPTSLPLRHYFSLFLTFVCLLLLLWRPLIYPEAGGHSFVFQILHQITNSCCSSSISLCAELAEPSCIRPHLSPNSKCWAVKRFSSIALHTEDSWGCRWPPLGDDNHDIHYPRNCYYFNKIPFVFIKACLIVILHD